MIDLIDNRTLLIVGCPALVVAGLIGVPAPYSGAAQRARRRRQQLVAVSEVTRDWQPTWKINAVTDAWVMEHQKDDIPSNFVLRIEENRMVRDIGGGEMMEIRWRPPTKAEVREIVRRYHDVPNEATVTPFDVIGFEKRMHAGASNEFYADRANVAAASSSPRTTLALASSYPVWQSDGSKAECAGR